HGARGVPVRYGAAAGRSARGELRLPEGGTRAHRWVRYEYGSGHPHPFGGRPRTRAPRVVRGLARRLRSAADGAARPWAAHARFRSFAGPKLRHRAWRLLPAFRAPRWRRNAGAQTLVLEHVVQALPRHPAPLARGARRRLLARCVRPT